MHKKLHGIGNALTLPNNVRLYNKQIRSFSICHLQNDELVDLAKKVYLETPCLHEVKNPTGTEE